jgi:hypothetical protein
VHEGRELPVKQQDAGQVALGPVANEATFRATALAAHAPEHEDAGHGNGCRMNHLIGRALAGLRSTDAR